MRSVLVLSCLVGLASCAKRDDRPAWAKVESGTAGDGTVTGEPLRVARFSSKPNLDGTLDDAVWQQAGVAGPFVGPGNGEDAAKHPVAGFAKLGWDDEGLYVGAIVQDKSPFSPFGKDDRDPRIWERSSAVELMIQPGDPGDNRDYYEIQIDVAGAVFDTHWDDYNKPIAGEGAARTFGHEDWSCRAERAITTKEGSFYAIEAKLPWSAFAKGRVAIPPKPGDVWRVNLYSFRDGQRLALAWSPIRGQGNFHRSTRFGRVRFE